MFGTLATFLTNNEKMPFRAVVKEMSEPNHYTVNGQARCKLTMMVSDGKTAAVTDVHQTRLIHGFFKVGQTYGFRNCLADGDKIIVSSHSSVFIIAAMELPEEEVFVPSLSEALQSVRKRSLKTVSEAVTSPKKSKFGIRGKILKVEPTIHRKIDGQMTPITNILVADTSEAVLKVGCFRKIAETASSLSPDTNVYLSDLFKSNYQQYPSASTTEKTEIQILSNEEFQFDIEEAIENSVFNDIRTGAEANVTATITGFGFATVYGACPQEKCVGKKMQPTKDSSVQCPECGFVLENEETADLGLVFDACMDVNGHNEDCTFYSDSTLLLCGFEKDEKLGNHSLGSITELLLKKLPIKVVVTRDGTKWKIVTIMQ